MPSALASVANPLHRAVLTVLHLHGWAAYGVVGALSFGEAAVFLGFVLPGETAVFLGGVLASQHHVSLGAMMSVAVLSAIAGDTVGYEVGRHLGPRLLRTRMLRHRHRGIARAQAYLQAKGGRAVLLGRFTAFFRAVMPGLAGMSRMPYRRFLAFNALGAVIWGGGFTLLGFLAGASWQRVERLAGRFSLVLLAVVVTAVGVVLLRARAAERRADEDETADARPFL